MNAIIVLGTGMALLAVIAVVGWHKGRGMCRGVGDVWNRDLPACMNSMVTGPRTKQIQKSWLYRVLAPAGFLLWYWYEKLPGSWNETARQRLRQNLSGLMVRDNVEEIYCAFQIRRFTRVWLLTAAALLAGMVMEVVSLYAVSQPVTRLPRPTAGGNSVLYRLEAEGVWEGKKQIAVSVAPRIYTRQQTETMFEEIYVQALQLLPGENTSLDQVIQPLHFLKSGPPGITIRWVPERWEYIDRDGNVIVEEIPEEGILTYVTMMLSYDTQHVSYQIPCRLIRPTLSDRQLLEQELDALLKIQEENGLCEDQVVLPDRHHGQPVVFYRAPGKAKGLMTGVLGVLVAVLCGMQCVQSVEEQGQARDRQMQADYPEILSKLTVLLVAGFTLRGAWEKIAGNYEAQIQAGNKGKRYAYEEMLYACRGMQSGQPELQAYKGFGKRCGLAAYRRLSMLLEQNLKRGGKELTDRLRAETEEAFSTRIHQARREGEKTRTKLMIPMFMMFILVLILIMAPAVMSFSGM